MREFERTALRSVCKKIDDGVGFVVGGHNYGRVDRMDDQELRTVAEEAGKIARQASELLDAIGIVSFSQQD